MIFWDAKDTRLFLILRRFWEGFWGRLLRRVLKTGLAMGCTVKRVSEKASSEGVSAKAVSRRRCTQNAPSESTTPYSGTTTKYSKWHFPAEKSVDFPPWGLLTFSGNPCDLGPKIEKIQDRPPGLKFSIEIENSNLDPQQTTIFVGNSEGQDWNFQSGLKFSSEIEIFNLDWFFSIFGPLGLWFAQ